MPHSLAQIYLHLVYSTKQRQPFLMEPSLRTRTHAYLAAICNRLGSQALAVGGIEDHVHLLVRGSRTQTIADLIREQKRVSSVWLKEQHTDLAEFHWQEGYGVFSISPAHVKPLKKYIANQEEHHRRESFQDEYRRLLHKYGLEWDERYVWD